MAQLKPIDTSRIAELTEKDWDKAAKLAIDRLNEAAQSVNANAVTSLSAVIPDNILQPVKAKMAEDGAAFEYICDVFTGQINENASESNYTKFGATVAGGALIGALVFPPLGLGIAAGGLVAMIANRSDSGWAELESLKNQAEANRQQTVLQVAAFTGSQTLYFGRQRVGKDLADIYIRMGKTLDYYRSALALSRDLNIWNQLKGVFAAVFNFIVDLLKTLGRVIVGLVKGVAGLVTGVASLLPLLPWILIGGAVLFFVVPPAIRLIRAKRRGGTDALLEESEKILDAGRERVKSGAAFAAKAGASYATKNPALLLPAKGQTTVNGLRRRHARRSTVSRRKTSK